MDREKQVLDGILRVVNKYVEPKKIFLFGSRTENRARRESDFDIALECEKPDFRKETLMREELDKVLGLYSVDIVYMPEVEDDFRKIILNTGKVIYERKN